MPYSLLHSPVEGVTAGGGGRREGLVMGSNQEMQTFPTAELQQL